MIVFFASAHTTQYTTTNHFFVQHPKSSRQDAAVCQKGSCVVCEKQDGKLTMECTHQIGFHAKMSNLLIIPLPVLSNKQADSLERIAQCFTTTFLS